MKQILFTAPKVAELATVSDPDEPLAPEEVEGRTVVSLVSPGTEVNMMYLGGLIALGGEYPSESGYACVFEVEAVGSAVTDLAPGDLVFGSGIHAERQRVERDTVIPLPAGLAPEVAVFARLMGVSMSTLNTCAANPPARVLVTGLGPVGNLAAQIFARCGYEVTAIDPISERREAANAVGISDARPSTEGSDDLTETIALHIDCSGHEQAILDGCKCVVKRGEVVLLGTPWEKRTELPAYDLLKAIFFGYVVVRSGWEWEVPEHPREFAFNSIEVNYRTALKWLSEGSIQVDGLAGTFLPTEAPQVYAGLSDRSLGTPGALFDWRG
jgi:threonine dehydrogenase-like Zn-dependent dehydrogenase